jgi:hypothetical protein
MRYVDAGFVCDQCHSMPPATGRDVTSRPFDRARSFRSVVIRNSHVVLSFGKSYVGTQ